MNRDDLIKNTIVELLKRASTTLPSDIKIALQKSYESEDSEIAKMQLSTILENIKLAEDLSVPICQDTGIPTFYVKLDTNHHNIEKCVREGVIEATKRIPLRPNTVHPLSRNNPGTNVGEHIPHIYYDIEEESNGYLEISVLLKGAGSENVSALKMLNPIEGISGLKRYILSTIADTVGRACPPVILGIGIGGGADIACKLAKIAHLRPINQRHKDTKIAELELELLEYGNKLGIGPMGLGGNTTLLGVNIEYAYCHTASYPVALNVMCWAARRCAARIYPDNSVVFMQSDV